METYIRGFESVGQYQDTYGSLLVPIVLDKLPGEILRNLACEHGDSNWNLDDLRRAINREINIIEAGVPGISQTLKPTVLPHHFSPLKI